MYQTVSAHLALHLLDMRFSLTAAGTTVMALLSVAGRLGGALGATRLLRVPVELPSY